MRFSWKALMLAPLPVPILASAVMAPLLGTGGPLVILPFVIILIPGCVISYGATIVLLLPALFLLSLWRPITGPRACLLGALLGAAVYVPLTLLAWKSSGPDSGPPDESFLVFFLRWSADPLTAVFPVAGLVTAGLYWWLARLDRDPPLPDFALPPVP